MEEVPSIGRETASTARRCELRDREREEIAVFVTAGRRASSRPEEVTMPSSRRRLCALLFAGSR